MYRQHMYALRRRLVAQDRAGRRRILHAYMLVRCAPLAQAQEWCWRGKQRSSRLRTRLVSAFQLCSPHRACMGLILGANLGTLLIHIGVRQPQYVKMSAAW